MMSRMLLVPIFILWCATLSLPSADKSLIQAAQEGDAETVQALLEKGVKGQ